MLDTRPQGGDRHIRRKGSDYTQAMLRLLPQGQAWPRAPDSTLAKTVDGLAQYYGFVDGRAADLLERDSDPRKTSIATLPDEFPTFGANDGLLPDWERAWGLPDPCFPTATTIAERQRMLILYMTWLGGQSRAYFIELMKYAAPGTEITYVGEFAPFMCGISQVGDTRPQKINELGETVTDTSKNFRWYIGPPEQRFSWFVNIGTATVTWFRAGSGQAGVDPHVRVGIPEELLCLLNRWKPSHTHLTFDLSALAWGGPMQGTP